MSDRSVYSVESLSRGMREFERFFGMKSDDFYERHCRDDPELRIPRYERHVWASFYEDVQRMRGHDAVMDRVSRTFAVSC